MVRVSGPAEVAQMVTSCICKNRAVSKQTRAVTITFDSVHPNDDNHNGRPHHQTLSLQQPF